jgi:hypothetical protein
MPDDSAETDPKNLRQVVDCRTTQPSETTVADSHK